MFSPAVDEACAPSTLLARFVRLRPVAAARGCGERSAAGDAACGLPFAVCGERSAATG
jgi:hypothetical protein